MPYRIEWKPSALREFKKLPADIRVPIQQAVEGLAFEPRPTGCRKLAGLTNAYRVRVGEYRVVYEVVDKLVLVSILRVRHRGDAYRQ